jgi:hypothetical protein
MLECEAKAGDGWFVEGGEVGRWGGCESGMPALFGTERSFRPWRVRIGFSRGIAPRVSLGP